MFCIHWTLKRSFNLSIYEGCHTGDVKFNIWLIYKKDGRSRDKTILTFDGMIYHWFVRSGANQKAWLQRLLTGLFFL